MIALWQTDELSNVYPASRVMAAGIGLHFTWKVKYYSDIFFPCFSSILNWRFSFFAKSDIELIKLKVVFFVWFNQLFLQVHITGHKNWSIFILWQLGTALDSWMKTCCTCVKAQPLTLSFMSQCQTPYLFRSADKAEDKHLFSWSLCLRSLTWNSSLAASLVIMVCYVL